MAGNSNPVGGGGSSSSTNMGDNMPMDDTSSSDANLLNAVTADNDKLKWAKAAYQSKINWAGFDLECIQAESSLANKLTVRLG
jgi:hypothetical protein